MSTLNWEPTKSGNGERVGYQKKDGEWVNAWVGQRMNGQVTAMIFGPGENERTVVGSYKTMDEARDACELVLYADQAPSVDLADMSVQELMGMIEGATQELARRIQADLHQEAPESDFIVAEASEPQEAEELPW